ncbi:hypothetical protein G6038_17530 [Rhodococcus sp. 14C212]|uniref:hypothetical protein n=1 Tax=Rhodococcus sp. 14C212 TaxID=2711209 RepID=UPI0013EB9BE5|nr:hypothetical protein [Rhodococcus sp. 14C212]
MRLSNVPLRLATGAFILNSGLGKRDLPPEAAAGLQDMASKALPRLGKMRPETFGQALSTAEIGVGALLLAPVVSPVVAGAALTAFSSGLLAMYWRMPGMHEGGSFRPTQQGTPIAKDVWLLGTGLSLIISGMARN